MEPIRKLLADGAVEEACATLHVLQAEDPATIERLGPVARDLYYAVLDHDGWRDPAGASRAFRLCLEIAYILDFVDGDTPTYLLMRAIEQTPGDDELVLEYVRQVADTDYCSTSRSLGELAQDVPNPALARRLAAAHTLTEYFCVRGYLPTPIYHDAMQRAFKLAVELGVDEAGWAEVRARLLAAAPFAEVPEDLFARHAGATG